MMTTWRTMSASLADDPQRVLKGPCERVALLAHSYASLADDPQRVLKGIMHDLIQRQCEHSFIG